MRNVVGVASLIVAGSMCSALLGAGPEAKLRGELVQIVANAEAGQLIPITIIMQDQVDPDELARFTVLKNKQMRRAGVISLLKNKAQIGQQGLLNQLAAERMVGQVGGRLRPLWLHSLVATQATAAAIGRIAQRDDVAYINSARPRRLGIFPVEPPEDEPDLGSGPTESGGNIECGVNIMRAPEVWNDLGITGEGVVVGIIDSGACITHPDLANQIWTNVDEIPNNGIDDDNNGYIDDIVGWDFWGPPPDNNVNDTNGHGTHTTGTVAGDGTNGTTTGMAPNVEMMILRISFSINVEWMIWEAMQYAVNNGADVITASIGWLHAWNPDRVTWRNECLNAIAAGVVVIYAAGNEGCQIPPDEIRTPGDVPEIITVGATDCNDNLASFSSCGPVTWENIPPWNDCEHPPGCIKPTIAAPGVNTISTSLNCSGYTSLSGTSMSTPHVAGAVALILDANPNLDPAQVKEILQLTAVDLGASGDDNNYGAGRVDAMEAVLLALDMVEACPWDMDGSGETGLSDLLSLLEQWGTDPGGPPDFDEDGNVSLGDLLILLANWGPCP